MTKNNKKKISQDVYILTTLLLLRRASFTNHNKQVWAGEGCVSPTEESGINWILTPAGRPNQRGGTRFRSQILPESAEDNTLLLLFKSQATFDNLLMTMKLAFAQNGGLKKGTMNRGIWRQAFSLKQGSLYIVFNNAIIYFCHSVSFLGKTNHISRGQDRLRWSDPCSKSTLSFQMMS